MISSVDKMGSLLTREWHLRTPSFRRYNFCGPNTRLNRRLNADGTPQKWSQPINKIDEISLRHDIAYSDGKRPRYEADKAMLHELDELNDEDLSCNEMFAKYYVRCIIGLLYRLRKLFA